MLNVTSDGESSFNDTKSLLKDAAVAELMEKSPYFSPLPASLKSIVPSAELAVMTIASSYRTMLSSSVSPSVGEK